MVYRILHFLAFVGPFIQAFDLYLRLFTQARVLLHPLSMHLFLNVTLTSHYTYVSLTLQPQLTIRKSFPDWRLTRPLVP